jgi:hypothetical protein
LFAGYKYIGIYQQMVKRYKGIEDARAVFAKVRRVLAELKNTNAQKRTHRLAKMRMKR